MSQVVRNTLILTVALCVFPINVEAGERYHIDATATRYYWLNSSTTTYDIDVRRSGIDIGEPVESRLSDVPIGGNLLQVYSELDKNRRVNAETELLKAKTELLKFQLAQQKKQRQSQKVYHAKPVNHNQAMPSRYKQNGYADIEMAMLIAKIAHNVDFSTGALRLYRAGYDPSLVLTALKHAPTVYANITKSASDTLRGKRKLARMLKLNEAETQYLCHQIDSYESKYETDTKTAAFMYLVYDYKMKSGKASAMVNRLSHYF